MNRCTTKAQAGERGSATVEFTALTLLLIIPVAYLLFTLLSVQHAAFAASSAARQGARIVAEARDEQRARLHVSAVGELTARELAIDDAAVSMQLQCEQTPCLTGGARIAVRATISMPLPLIPAMFAGVLPTHTQLTSTSIGVVNPYLERP